MGRMGEGAEVILTGDAVVGEVIDGKFFYKDDPLVRLEGTMDTVAIVAANDNYPAGYHVGNVGGLDAIDPDLTGGNIKTGVTIFGKGGTVKAVYDVQSKGYRNQTPSGSISAGGEIDAETQTRTVTAGSIVFGAMATAIWDSSPDHFKVKLFIDGVQKGETGFVPDIYDTLYLSSYTANLSGSIVVKNVFHNYDGSSRNVDSAKSAVFLSSAKV